MALFFSSPDWRDRLREGSFRGVPFSVSDDAVEFGRRVKVHEYPNRDKPFSEDLGRETRRFQVTAYLVGDDYATQRDRLIQAVETAGPGTLVLPQYGEMQGSIDGNITIKHSTAEGRLCRISFKFVESGELAFPTSGLATGKQLALSSSLLGQAVEGALATFSLGGLPDFVQGKVIDDATQMLETVTRGFQMVDSGVTDAMRLLQGDLSVILMPPSRASDLVHALQNAWQAGDRLQGNTHDLVTLVKTLSGITLDPGLAPRGEWPTDSGTRRLQSRRSNLLASAIRVSALSEAARTVTLLPPPASATRQLSPGAALVGGTERAVVSDIRVVDHPALDSLAASVAGVEPASWDELQELRQALNQALDHEQLRLKQDDLFTALSQVQVDVNRDLVQRLAQTDRTASRTPVGVQPALVLAASWYDDAGRERDILSRNPLHHPGFVPVRPLRVPVQ